jgi:hypothetical protein
MRMTLAVKANRAFNPIIYRPTEYGSLKGFYAFNISDWAWAHLNNYPELLAPSHKK